MAVASEGLTFTDAHDIHNNAVVGVLRAAVDMRRELQEANAMRSRLHVWWRCTVRRDHYPCRGCTPPCGKCSRCHRVL